MRLGAGEDGPVEVGATLVPAVLPQSRLAVASDGTAVLDGRTLHLAGDGRLSAVDVMTGAVVRTAESPATRLARTPDGRLAAA